MAFPATPANGQIFIDPTTGVSYTYNAVLNSWPKTSVATTVNVDTFANRPAAANEGDIYIIAGDPNLALNGMSFVWDATFGMWFQLNQNNMIPMSATTGPQAAIPAGANEGDIYVVDSDPNPVLDGRSFVRTAGGVWSEMIGRGTVRTVNAVGPDANGNVAVSIANVTTGVLAALPAVADEGDVYVVAGDPVANENGRTFIRTDAGTWVEISGLDVIANDARYVNVGGDTMTGPLVLPADPALPLEAATKQYVDSRFSKYFPTITIFQADTTTVFAEGDLVLVGVPQRIYRCGTARTGYAAGFFTMLLDLEPGSFVGSNVTGISFAPDVDTLGNNNNVVISAGTAAGLSIGEPVGVVRNGQTMSFNIVNQKTTPYTVLFASAYKKTDYSTNMGSLTLAEGQAVTIEFRRGALAGTPIWYMTSMNSAGLVSSAPLSQMAVFHKSADQFCAAPNVEHFVTFNVQASNTIAGLSRQANNHDFKNVLTTESLQLHVSANYSSNTATAATYKTGYLARYNSLNQKVEPFAGFGGAGSSYWNTGMSGIVTLNPGDYVRAIYLHQDGNGISIPGGNNVDGNSSRIRFTLIGRG